MSSLLGIDLGTSSVKVVVYSTDGSIRGLGSAEYPILTPSVGYAEQEPEDWWRATVVAVRQAMEKAGRPDIAGIGFSGQMHGFVLIGNDRKALSPAIIWADQRSADLLPEIESIVGPDLKKCGTAPAAGFHDLDVILAAKASTGTARPCAHFVDAEGLHPIENYRGTWDGPERRFRYRYFRRRATGLGR